VIVEETSHVVSKEYEIEFAALGRLRNSQQQWKVLTACSRNRESPASDVVSGADCKHTDVHLPLRFGHGMLST